MASLVLSQVDTSGFNSTRQRAKWFVQCPGQYLLITQHFLNKSIYHILTFNCMNIIESPTINYLGVTVDQKLK